MAKAQKHYHVLMPDKSQQRVLFLDSGKNGRVWSKHPKEFGAPYRLNFVDDDGRTARYGVGVFLPNNGGGWHIWGAPNSYKDLHFVTYDMNPLHYIGWPRQYFQHFLTAKPAQVNLPDVYMVGRLREAFQLKPEGALFGDPETLSGSLEAKDRVKTQILTKYSELIPIGRDTYKVECPMCDDGVLLLRRDPNTMNLLPDDNCISCGQAVHFIDMNL